MPDHAGRMGSDESGGVRIQGLARNEVNEALVTAIAGVTRIQDSGVKTGVGFFWEIFWIIWHGGGMFPFR